MFALHALERHNNSEIEEQFFDFFSSTAVQFFNFFCHTNHNIEMFSISEE